MAENPQPAARTLGAAAVAVLTTANALDKAAASRATAQAWWQGRLAHGFDMAPPARPARPDRPKRLPPNKMPTRGRGSRAGRIALLHAVAHIELNAIDLAWDMVARFGDRMPRGFVDDWVRVGDDEARHFRMLQGRLESLDAAYGDLPAHDGLWEASMATADDLLGRLAVVPMVLEARGLDVTPGMIDRFATQGDHDSAAVLRVIYEDEIGHVAAGQRWFSRLCARRGLDRQQLFQEMVGRYFRGSLKPPFNTDARAEAGVLPDWYAPLAMS